MPTLYETLDVSADATTEEIDRSYRHLARRHHPDMGGNGDEFRRVTAAYEVLKDTERRRRYDETGKTDQPADESLTMIVTCFCEILIESIGNGRKMDQIDLVKMTKERLLDVRKSTESARKKLVEHAAKMQDVADRIESNDGNNFLRSAVLGPLKKIESEIVGCDTMLGQLDRCGEILKHYTYRHDEPTSATWPDRQPETRGVWVKFTME